MTDFEEMNDFEDKLRAINTMSTGESLPCG